MTLHLDRKPRQHPPKDWAYWHVVDGNGEQVGAVGEWREWLGHGYGPVTYEVAHNPSGEPFKALWRSEGHDTPQDALAALCDHLARMK